MQPTEAGIAGCLETTPDRWLGPNQGDFQTVDGSAGFCRSRVDVGDHAVINSSFIPIEGIKSHFSGVINELFLVFSRTAGNIPLNGTCPCPSIHWCPGSSDAFA